MQVTRDNLDTELDGIRKAIDECSFFAMDMEFTGLNLRGENPTASDVIDNLQERFHKQSAGARSFLVLQFGLCCVRFDGNRWVAKTWSFYLFPTDLSGGDTFHCQVSSIKFLATHSFDFNRTFTQGIPFMPLSEYRRRLDGLDKPKWDKRSPIVLTAEADRSFALQFKLEVTAWLSDHEGPKSKVLIAGENSYRRAYAYQVLEEMQASQPEPPGFLARKHTDDAGAVGIEVERVTAAEAAAEAAAKREAAEEELRASAGFAHVFGMLLASGKPAVGHNCMLDLLHAMRAFHGPLPATWDEFQRTTADAFTGGLYDTKHMARQHDAVFRGNTALKDTHDTMALLAEEHKGPTVAHATGFSMEDGREHDAGYDAYLTACAFAHMLAILPDAPASPDAAVSPPRLRVLPEALLVPSSPFAVRYLNKVNVMQSDYPCAVLGGPQPDPDRSHVLWVTGFPPRTPPGALVAALRERCKTAGLRVGRVALKGDGGALVVLPDADDSALRNLAAACKALPKWEEVTVASYAEYVKAMVLTQAPRGSKNRRDEADDSTPRKQRKVERRQGCVIQ